MSHRKRKYAHRARLATERLELRNLLAADWMLQNPVDAEDVNDDGAVSPLDALHVINHLNAPGDVPSEQAFLDVNNDGECSPQDALGVINRLNRGADSVEAPMSDPVAADSAGPAEGEAIQRVAPRPGPSVPLAPASINGTGNNIAHPDWGTAGVPFLRTAPAEYGDGISTPGGADRPNPRTVSNAIGDEEEAVVNDRHMTAMVYAWGQFLDHDLDLTDAAQPTESFSIAIPSGDPEFDPAGTGTQVMPLSRSQFAADTGTSVENPRQQFNSITAFLDGSQVYGSDDVRAEALRTKSGGKLKTSDDNLLPYNTEGLPNASFDSDPAKAFLAGDIRANENAELLSLHTLFVREHNRLADEIAKRDPTLSDEAIYQQARAMVKGELQAITYNEFLPTLIGMDALRPYRGYQPDVNPGIANEFATAAYRVGHTMLEEDIEFLDNDGNEVHEPVALRDAFFNPSLMSETGIDSVLNYLAADNMREVDTKIVEDVRNFLFGPPGSGGMDLATLNIQRGRDHGLADYNATRAAYGLPRVTSFADITSDTELAGKLEELYSSVDNIDLWVGGLAEDHVPGSSVGPTFRRIIADQFERLRDGDRYWYQNAFDGRQSQEIERTTLSSVIRRNTTSDVTGNVFFDDSVLQQRTPRGGGDIVVASHDGTIEVMDRRVRQMLQDTLADEVGQIVIGGADDRPDRIMIDAARGTEALASVEVDGGAGPNDMLVVRAAPGTQSMTIHRRTIDMDGQTIDFSRFETVSLEAGRDTQVTAGENLGIDVLVNGRRMRSTPPATNLPPVGQPPTNPTGTTSSLPPSRGGTTSPPTPGGTGSNGDTPTSGAPVGSAPVGSAPVGSAPVGSAPTGRPERQPSPPAEATRPEPVAATPTTRGGATEEVIRTVAEERNRQRNNSAAIAATEEVFAQLGTQLNQPQPRRR